MTTDASALGVGLLILRLLLGLTMAAHGLNKFFGTGGLRRVAGWFDSIGMKPGMPNAVAAASTELGAGVALALGLATPLAAAAFVSLMAVAYWTVLRGKGFFATAGGWEYNLVLAGAAVAIATTGPGELSLDHLFFDGSRHADVLNGWTALAIAVGVGLAGAAIQVVAFFRPPASKVS
jgi:putative oxidoreductase